METCTVGSEGSAVKPGPAMDQGARRLPYNGYALLGIATSFAILRSEEA